MEYIGRVLENKDIVTKEYVDDITSKVGVVDELKGVESSMTATSAYSIGDYLRYIDSNEIKQIAKVKSAIASGDTLVVGTNIENITLAPVVSIVCTYEIYDALSSAEKINTGRFYYINNT